MVYSDRTYARRPPGFGGGGGPPPRDVLVLLVALFVTYSLQFFPATRIVPALLELTPWVWRLGFVWQLATYVFVGDPVFGLFFLLELLMIFWFGRDVYRVVGSRGFWEVLAWGGLTASIVAVLVQMIFTLLGGPPATPGLSPFPLIQGQHIVLTVLIAAFATLYSNATIYFMFVLPIRSTWFLWLEVLFGFMGFLTTKDFAGFVGLSAAVAVVYLRLSGRGLRKVLREARLRIERRVLEWRLRSEQRRRGFRVVKGGGGGGGGPREGNGRPWVN